MVVLIVLMRRRLNGIEGGYVFKGTLQAALATLAMSVALVVWLSAIGDASVWLVGVGGIAVGGAVYAALVFALKVPEARELLDAGLRRIRAKV
jgi:peptidoglycan biosynthesis protein MviN/MurJ (putative lipid II flippase)